MEPFANMLRLSFRKKKKHEKECEEIPYKACNCDSLNPRSESFYDLFLTSTAKTSTEYKYVLNEREKKKGKTKKCGEENHCCC